MAITLREAYAYKSGDHKPRTVVEYTTTVNHWERAALTVPDGKGGRMPARNPDLNRIDNATLLEYREFLSGRCRSSLTVRKHLAQLIAILNRIKPGDNGHPEALGFVDSIPHVKKPKAVRVTVPRVATDDESGRMFRAADAAGWPVTEVATTRDWWQSLIVCVYNTGLRVSDFMSLTWAEVDLAAGVMTFDAEKTGKRNSLPLHPIVIQYLQRIANPARAMVWPWRKAQAGPENRDRWYSSFRRNLERITDAAGLERKVTAHFLRGACGSGLFMQSTAVASWMLQHSSVKTTEESYTAPADHVREMVSKRSQPDGFQTDGPPEDRPHILKFPGGCSA